MDSDDVSPNQIRVEFDARTEFVLPFEWTFVAGGSDDNSGGNNSGDPPRAPLVVRANTTIITGWRG